MAADLERGREAFGRRAWQDARAALARADRSTPLDAADLERLATASYMLGREDEYLGILERAHQAHLDAGDEAAAVRCCFWLGLNLALRGETGGAAGWLARGRRRLEGLGQDRVEHGYLLLLTLFELDEAEWEVAVETAAAAADIGQRFKDGDLFALALHEQGHILVRHGRVKEGLRLQDEAMVALTTGELSPIATGLVYCAVIGVCQEVHELGRAQEWTAALTRWCEQQPGLVAFTGVCLVHRAELMQIHGAWREALDEARRPVLFRREGLNAAAAALAHYRQGELHRLRGDLAAAEDAYREASRSGYEPQPGLALLRLAQGKRNAAAAAIRRATDETSDAARRLSLLPSYVEIMLAIGDVGAARRASRELEALEGAYEGALVRATVARAKGSLELADGNPRAALAALRSAWQLWSELDAPYESARARELIGLACRAHGDEDTAAFELEAARDGFRELGAELDLARTERALHSTVARNAGGLTARELQVLALVAAGKTNRSIATDLVISEKTVARHVSNIFVKLRLSTRAAATAYAYEHELV